MELSNPAWGVDRWSYIHMLSLCGIVLLTGWTIYLGLMRRNRKAQTAQTFDDDPKNADPYSDIEPLEDVDWKAGEILQMRPFKPKYHLTMALSPCSLSELVKVDSTYMDRIELRRSLIKNNRADVIGVNPVASPAIQELYSWLVETYLPMRFPSMYAVEHRVSEPNTLRNRATGEVINLTPPPTSEEALAILGSHIDIDFLVLLPSTTHAPSDAPPEPPGSSKTQEHAPYILHAFITCFPAGFATAQKISNTLADIHIPVPGYDKIRKSMDRFFATLPVGKIVQRANWSITTGGELFVMAGSHMSEEEYALNKEEKEAVKEMAVEEVEENKKNIWVRCERQTLHRLPKTKALVFGVKTYVYPIEDIKAEGNAEVLAEAIEGLGKGNVENMRVYKRSVVWGPAVCEWLRKP
ncbi:hypothetical protein P152DRAFT_473281 [Eremomyces bilateralis CBS 781.70]|uniref:HRQ family protein 2 n=1 Tax=Eremomyces bilateralis CBS 781.70 TaxID=1392243 RepID=A0A6G1G489_9PEZI|nr:uncharacterized protein P152DRAFT_473281 [Eremomyces bilateralis CBS 781.70]KAF1812730.1 hypothetical protein P152DRAFT_473281 [Eremomyces bilateralis CBS 781.70]